MFTRFIIAETVFQRSARKPLCGFYSNRATYDTAYAVLLVVLFGFAVVQSLVCSGLPSSPQVAAADSPSAGGGNPGVDANSAVGVQGTTQAETGRDEDEQKEAEPVAEEKEESPVKAQQPVDHVERETFPATFDDLCLKFTERANFLLEVMHDTTVDVIHQPGDNRQ